MGWRSALAAFLGVAVGLACGAATRSSRSRPLPPAGDADDDGTGLLARWSRGELGGTRDPDALEEAGLYGGEMYGYAGDLYGGVLYGGAFYGGALYGVGSTFPIGPDLPDFDEMPSNTAAGYQVVTVRDPATITGTVSWKATARPPATGACPNASLSIGRNGGVAGAVVYLADVRAGKGAQLLGGVLERRGCDVVPHVQISEPIGHALVVTNGDAEPRDVRVLPRGPTFSLPGEAERELNLAEGFHEIDLGDAFGWVVVPPHPYYVVTDADGRYRLDDVPAGDYTLVVWHEPIRPGGGDPIEVRTRIRIGAGARINKDIRLK